jgi:hypothetical protein
MSSEEIRAIDIDDAKNGLQPTLELIVLFLREIAAQLAERNEQ